MALIYYLEFSRKLYPAIELLKNIEIGGILNDVQETTLKNKGWNG